MRVAVIGAGIAGLTAAHELARSGAEVVVFEGSPHVGGKLRSQRVGDVTVDVGAEALLARRPEGIDLITEVGWADRLVPPTVSQSLVARGEELLPWPRTVMGIPADHESVRALGVADIFRPSEPLAAPEGDESIAQFVSARMGRDVVDRLVEPMLAGVYAGDVDALSVQAAAPILLGLGPDLMAGAAERLANAPTSPALIGVRGGLGSLPARIIEHGGFEVRTSATVRAVTRDAQGWTLVVGPTVAATQEKFDAVIMAAPAPAASRLLAEVTPRASFALAGLEHASVAIITFVLDDAQLPEASGFLVPAVEGRDIKAATFSTQKWGWLAEKAGDRTIIRCSIGRHGHSQALQFDDATLTDIAHRSLTEVLGDRGHLGTLVDSHVQRWGGGLPQYAVGHRSLVDTVMTDVATVPGLEVCGAAYRGMGIPAVISTALTATHNLLGTSDLAAAARKER